MMMIRSALCRVDLDDESGNYTIGQLVTHLKLVRDFSDYDKVVNLLRKREDRVREEARIEMEDVVGRFEGRFEEAMKWKVMVEESLKKLEEEGRVLRERWEEREKGRVDELLKSKGVMEESVEKLWKENAELVKKNLRLKERVGMFKKVNGEFEEENARLRKEVGVWRERDEESKKLRVTELKSLRMRAEKDIEGLEGKVKNLAEENRKLRKKVKVWRTMSEDLREREEDAKVRLWELESEAEVQGILRVRAEEHLEELEHRCKNLEKENLRLREEVKKMNDESRKRDEYTTIRVWELESEAEVQGILRVRAEEHLEELEHRCKNLEEENLRLREEVKKMNDESRKRDEYTTIRVWELESKVEIEESLKLRVAEKLEALELQYKELQMTISATGKDRTGKVAREMSPMEAGGCSRRLNVVDLTEGVHPAETHAEDLIEASINTTLVNRASTVHISSDSDDDTSEAPLRIERKRKKRKSWNR